MNVVDCGTNDLMLIESDEPLSLERVERIKRYFDDWTKRNVLVVEPGLSLTLLRNGREALRVERSSEDV